MISHRSTISILASILVLGNSALAFAPPPTHAQSASMTPTTTTLMMTKSSSNSNRRNFLNDFSSKVAAAITLVGTTTAASSPSAYALDFDSFERGEIASDTAKCDPKKDPKCIPKLTSDEALCQYGGGGEARGEACMRVRKAGGKLPEIKKEKSLGGAYAM
ncbi:hypothetical protein ACHAWU_003226 [Discostella pseudostelligera]|uniref:Uncharacterized protein n=1 Tax=Discostella pseudostelligera TaxID=259834 RepID=A0ABD3N8N6_9STRA